jgi:ATPase family protein associated with various cellular activities (AAA)/alpha/beta hydrolase family protein
MAAGWLGLGAAMEGEWVRKKASDTVVVFVHGILSSGESAWRHPGGSYWPELLQHAPELNSVGIYVFTYYTGTFSGTYRVGDVVDSLKESLRLDGLLKAGRLIFVCHSLGGIVVRKYVVERAADLMECGIEIGLFLVASPSLGSSYANWVAPIARFLGHAQLEVLQFNQHNAWLNDLDKEFQNLKESGRLRIKGKELVEDRFVWFRRLWRRQLVESFAGARYFGDPFKVAMSDHFSIAKPENADAIQHRLLVSFITDMLKERSTEHDVPLHAEAPIMASATPAASLRGESISASEEKGVQVAGSSVWVPSIAPPPTVTITQAYNDTPAWASVGGDPLTRFANPIDDYGSWWMDLVLPRNTTEELHEIVQIALSRTRSGPVDVIQTIGVVPEGGIHVLFHGAHGTGKRLAAKVIAHELNSELYGINYTAVVEHHPVDTAKNLQKLFETLSTRNAWLLVHDAEVLFGAASDSGLLEIVELRGNVIFTTTRRFELDRRWLDRITHAIEFPFPDETARKHIWQRAIRPDVPITNDIDLQMLASRYALSGEGIRRAFELAVAQRQGRAVGMAELESAAARQLKAGAT